MTTLEQTRTGYLLTNKEKNRTVEIRRNRANDLWTIYLAYYENKWTNNLNIRTYLDVTAKKAFDYIDRKRKEYDK